MSSKILASLALIMYSLCSSAWAYPDRPVQLTIPYSPGGLTDNLGRLYAEQLAKLWKQPVVVENRPGAGSSIGASHVANSQADGYALLLGSVGMVTNPILMKKMPYPPGALAPVALIAVVPNILFVHSSVPATNVKELVDYGKANPGILTFASSGTGSSPHLAAELFAARAGMEIVHVPYKGTGPAMVDFLGGQVKAYFDTMQSMPYAKAGKIRPLAVAAAERIPGAPDLPTVQESGVAPGVFSASWFGVFMSAATPEDIKQQVVQALKAVSGNAMVRTRSEELGLIPDFRGASEFKAFLDDETKKWGDVIRAQKISID